LKACRTNSSSSLLQSDLQLKRPSIGARIQVSNKEKKPWGNNEEEELSYISFNYTKKSV